MADDTDLDAASECALANMARVRPVLDKIADKWTILILTVLCPRPSRFNAIKRRLALFWTKEADQYSDAFVYVRSVAVHALVLDSEQVRKGALARLVIASLTMIASLIRCARSMRCSTAS